MTAGKQGAAGVPVPAGVCWGTLGRARPGGLESSFCSQRTAVSAQSFGKTCFLLPNNVTEYQYLSDSEPRQWEGSGLHGGLPARASSASSRPRVPVRATRSAGQAAGSRPALPGQGAAPEPRAPLTPHRPRSPQARAVQSQSALQPPPALGRLTPRAQIPPPGPARAAPGAPTARTQAPGARTFPARRFSVKLRPLPSLGHACRLRPPCLSTGARRPRRDVFSPGAWPSALRRRGRRQAPPRPVTPPVARSGPGWGCGWI